MKCPNCNSENRPEARFCKQCGQPLQPEAPAAATRPSAMAASLHQFPPRPDRERRVKLHRTLDERFDLEELRTLCFDLDVKYDDLRGEGKTAKARELVDFFSRRDRILELERAIEEALATHKGAGTTDRPPTPRIPLERPARAEHFIDREQELAQLLADLQPGKLVTLCGPGGIGKSALAAEAIWTLAPGDDPPDRFPDGIIHYNFHDQPQVALAWEDIARAYGYSQDDLRPTPAEAVQHILSKRRALLLLDSTENADNLQAVLDVRGGCGVLITSRITQDAVSDWEDIGPLLSGKAVELLQAWGEDWAADESAADQICELVGCLPLAVRQVGHYLAHRKQEASVYLAWLQSSPLEALDQAGRREKSVPLLLERSISQVSKPAQDALAVISVLALSPFDGEVIAQALGKPSYEVSPFLGDLVIHGILIRPQKRYYKVSHALIHTYIKQRHSPSKEAVQKLASYYAALALEQSKLGSKGYARLDNERAHMMAVLAACAEQEAWDLARSLVWATDDYLDIKGYWTERVQAIETGIAAARGREDREDEGAFLNNLGLAYRNLGQAEEAIEQYKKALAIARKIGDRGMESNALGNLGIAYGELGQVKAGRDRQEAIEYLKQACDISREIGDRRNEGIWLGSLGIAYHRDLGQVEEAIKHHKEALDIAREIGDRRSEGGHLANLAIAYHRDLGQVEEAIKHHEEALDIAREIGDRKTEGICLGNLGIAYQRGLGQVGKAIEYYKQALVIAREIGNRRNEGDQLDNLGAAYRDLGKVEEAIEHHTQARDISREIGDRRGEGYHSWNLGLLYEESDPTRAAELMQVRVDYEREIGHPDADTHAERVRELLAKAAGEGTG